MLVSTCLIVRHATCFQVILVKQKVQHCCPAIVIVPCCRPAGSSSEQTAHSQLGIRHNKALALSSLALPKANRSLGKPAGVVGMCKEHMGVALALKVPVFFVVTKVDICPEHVLKHTLGTLQAILRKPGVKKKPFMVSAPARHGSTLACQCLGGVRYSHRQAHAQLVDVDCCADPCALA